MHIQRVLLAICGLSIISLAAPTPQKFGVSGGICIPATSTLYLTATPFCSPITIYYTQSTVYITEAISTAYIHVCDAQASTRTVTRTSFSTNDALHLEPALCDANAAPQSGSLDYEATTMETAHFIAYQTVAHQDTHQDPFSFYVSDGVTSWLGGQTPDPQATHVYASAIVTVIPVKPALALTTTLRGTVQEMSEATVTKTMPTSKVTITIGPGNSFTGMAFGGWNSTHLSRPKSSVAVGNDNSFDSAVGLDTGAAEILLATALNAAATNTRLTFVTNDPNFGLSPITSHVVMPIPSLASQSGSQAHATLVAPAVTQTEMSIAIVINPETMSWVPRPSQLSESSAIISSTIGAPFANSSSASPFSPSLVSGIATFNTGIILQSVSVIHNSSVILSSASTISGSPISSLMPSSTLSSASTTTSACGLVGDFVLNFDDIPPLSIGNQSIDTVEPAPIFSPYHLFDFSNGYVVVPPPRVPYVPSTRPLLLEFIPNFTVNKSSVHTGPNAGEYGWSGDIASGDHGVTSCFGFNMYGASIGCDSQGPACVFTFTGFRIDKATNLDSQVTQQSISVDACRRLSECPLTPITLDDSFQNLDNIRMNVTVGRAPRLWWMDDVRMGWYDNTCITGLCRKTAKIH